MEVAFSERSQEPGVGPAVENPGSDEEERGGVEPREEVSAAPAEWCDTCREPAALGCKLDAASEKSRGDRKSAKEGKAPEQPAVAADDDGSKPAPVRARYNQAVVGRVGAEDREAALPILPTDWEQRLRVFLKAEMLGKPRTPTTTLIMKQRARDWVAKFDIQEVGFADSPLVSQVIAGTVAAAICDCSEDLKIMAAVQSNLDYVNVVNGFYGRGVLGWKVDWWKILGGAALLSAGAVGFAHWGFLSAQKTVLNAPSEAGIHVLDKVFLEPAPMVWRRAVIPAVSKVSRELGRSLTRWVCADRLAPSPMAGPVGFYTFCSVFAGNVGVLRSFVWHGDEKRLNAPLN